MYVDPTGNIGTPISWAMTVIAGVAGGFYGNYLADQFNIHGWQRWVFVGAVAVGGAAIGFVAGEVLVGFTQAFLYANPAVLAKMPAAVLTILGMSQASQLLDLVDDAALITQNIVNINKLYSTGQQLYNSVSSIVNSASYYSSKYDQVSSIVRGIAQHAFENGNKRTAVDTLFMLLKDIGVKSSITRDQAWQLIDDIANGVIKSVSEISNILQRK